MSKRLSKRDFFGTIAGLACIAAIGFSAANLFAGPAMAAVAPGETVPDFSVVDSNGETRSLSEFEGKKVILEWTNHDCPYVKKHYHESRKNMQTLQTDMTGNDVVWLSVISSAPGKQGHVSGAEANELTTSRQAAPSYVLLDESGDIGRLYDAKTTPHMYIIDEQQVLQYAGAIDSKRSSSPDDIDDATNYVRQALTELEAGEEVSKAYTMPYGCSVKY